MKLFSSFNFSNMAQFTSIVRHAESSLGEGSPVLFRIMMDQFTGYLPGYNNVSTNYTGGRGVSLLIQDEEDRQGSYVEVVVSSLLSSPPDFTFRLLTVPGRHHVL